MRLEDHVCSLSSAKRLKNFGLTQESIFYWSELHYGGSAKIVHESDCRHKRARELYSAFTVSELLVNFPAECHFVYKEERYLGKA